jgi:uncharacterized membrane protein YfcA
LSFLLTIEGMLAACFVVAVILGLLLPDRWKTVGWALTALAAAYAAVRAILGAGQLTDIFFAALWAALGAFPGAALGSWVRRRFKPPA